jgi:hypothetical protein
LPSSKLLGALPKKVWRRLYAALLRFVPLKLWRRKVAATSTVAFPCLAKQQGESLYHAIDSGQQPGYCNAIPEGPLASPIYQ